MPKMKTVGNNSVVAALSLAMRGMMVLGHERPLSRAEREMLKLIHYIKGGVKKELWPQILYFTLYGLAVRYADLKVAGETIGTLWALDPERLIPQDDVRDFCLGGHHDALLRLLEEGRFTKLTGN